MPYFKKKSLNANIFYIHVPKTGGMSIEQYFYNKFNIERNYKNAYGYVYPNVDYNKLFGKGHTLQHIPYTTIITYGHELFELDDSTNDLIFLATVRNPYDRIVSDLFFFIQYTGITITSTKIEIEHAIYKYLTNEEYDYDNHRIPQCKLLKDAYGNIPNNMIILKTEVLTEEMHKMGFTDFYLKENMNRCGVNVKYMDLLTHQSIQWINDYYYEDFQIFCYPMIQL
jgi:hypothetical protein